MRAETKQQLRRMSGLLYFPTDGMALDELGRAAEVGSVEALREAVSEWLTAQHRTPSPAELRAAVLAANHRPSSGPKCDHCDGAAWVTVYRLVTFWENSFRIRRSESLDHMTFEAIQAARGEVGKHQEVITAAKPCPACRGTVAA